MKSSASQIGKYGRKSDVLRPAISMFMFCAAPDIADPTAKNTNEASITGRLPNIWANPPDSGKKAVEERAYEVPTQTNSVPWRSLTIVGRAVETDV